jgi:hypothetical protein
MKRGLPVCVLCLLLLVQATLAQESEPSKKKISGIDDLPRRNYQITGSVADMIVDDGAFESFAAKVRADVEYDLTTYEIEDRTTLKDFYSVIINLDMLEQQYDHALELLDIVRELQDKEASKYVTGILNKSIIEAHKSAGVVDGAAFNNVLARTLAAIVESLPWDIVQERIEEMKGNAEMFSENFLMSIVKGQFEPVVEQTGNVSTEIAYRIINIRYIMNVILPLKETIVETLDKYITLCRVEKPDIWDERNIELSGSDHLAPVVIAIWDSGVDTGVFPSLLYVNSKEVVDGVDNDTNGFVDDINGIAYDIEEEKTPDILYPLEVTREQWSEMVSLIKGFFDLQSSINSEEASAIRQKISVMQPEEFNAFFEELTKVALHAHGTHVAGIAVHGNPYARILVVRFTTDYHIIPKAPTIELSRKMARNYKETIAYMQAHSVRVVNMSWGGTLRGTERDLEANGIGETAEERARMAREMFDIEKQALYEAMKNAPEILFINAAGNDNDNVAFEDYYPAAFDLPNLLVVGAVDKAGDVTSFTSFGPTVDVYANGYEVESYLPGGERLAASGTSASSPNAVNLAAKLLAIDPSLKPSEAIDLIIKGAQPNDEGLLLIDPKRSVKLLESFDRKTK